MTSDGRPSRHTGAGSRGSSVECGQVDESGIRTPEPARVSIEAGEVRLVVDVEPLAACSLRVPGSAMHDLRADATALSITARLASPPVACCAHVGSD
jgi:hypothetical protein